MNKKKKRRLFLIYSATIPILLILFFIPLPYIVIFPGELINLSKVVSIENEKENKSHFFAVSSDVYFNPYAKTIGLTKNSFETNLFVFLIGKLSPNAEIMKIPPGYENITTNEIADYNFMLMEQSQEISKNLALKYLGLSKAKINISFGSLAGSSGSLMTTLEIINQLNYQDLIKGRKIAGTGELNESGDVLAIGNVNQKIYTAEKNGVDIIIIPEANRGNVSIQTQLKIIYVKNLPDTISKLK